MCQNDDEGLRILSFAVHDIRRKKPGDSQIQVPHQCASVVYENVESLLTAVVDAMHRGALTHSDTHAPLAYQDLSESWQLVIAALAPKLQLVENV